MVDAFVKQFWPSEDEWNLQFLPSVISGLNHISAKVFSCFQIDELVRLHLATAVYSGLEPYNCPRCWLSFKPSISTTVPFSLEQ